MKKYSYILPAALLLTGLNACNQDHEPDWNETAPSDIKVKEVSVQDGALLNDGSNLVEITYDRDIAINNLVDVTLKYGRVDSVKVKSVMEEGVLKQYPNVLQVYFNLPRGRENVLVVPERKIAGLDTKTFAPEVKINIKTASVKDALVKDLTNPNATAEAKKVFEFLQSNYGDRQVSGVMGGVAWDNSFYNFACRLAKKDPAIIGFDFIHLAYSPANWIDYSDLTPIKSAWDNGNIPTFTWHWNVPLYDGCPINEYNAKIKADDSSWYNNFKAENVLIEGTWENKFAEESVEKVAGYLKLIQDAGIPVLWRPFHEAAGDYAWGPWFWWGNSGLEVTKKLWIWLRDKLQNEYGINNLIWVWTVQTSYEGKIVTAPTADNEGSLHYVAEAYPGDEYVDIVGVDLYESALSDQSAHFDVLYNLVGGKKMVALSETGNLMDPTQDYGNGALWSYFMSWYELKDGEPAKVQYNLNHEWSKVLSNPLVINRGGVTL